VEIESVKISEGLRLEFERAVSNIVRACKRSLLDIIDMQVVAVGNFAVTCPDPKVEGAVDQIRLAIDGTLRRRIHSDVSDIGPTVMAEFELQVKDFAAPRFRSVVNDSVAHCERSLMDVIDIELTSFSGFKSEDTAVMTAITNARVALEILARRVKADVGSTRSKILSSFQIVENGGRIPAFGRTVDQIGRDRPERARPGVAG
jgi:hypothetical protein